MTQQWARRYEGGELAPPEQDTRCQATLALFDKLDTISRQRALTDEESQTLETVQNTLMSSHAWGLRKELARRGIPSRGRR